MGRTGEACGRPAGTRLRPTATGYPSAKFRAAVRIYDLTIQYTLGTGNHCPSRTLEACVCKHCVALFGLEGLLIERPVIGLRYAHLRPTLVAIGRRPGDVTDTLPTNNGATNNVIIHCNIR